MGVAILLVALVFVGVMAGLFFAFAISVMPGLARTDDRTFVAAFRGLDRAIINPFFLFVFLGALVFTGIAGLFFLGEGRGGVLGLIIAAFVLYLVVIGITGRVNVPLNNGLQAAGDLDAIDVAAVREQFSEDVWVRWNWIRTALNVAAFVCLAWALALAGGL